MSYLTDERSLFGVGTAEDVALYQQGRGRLTSNVGEGDVFLSTRGDDSVPDCQFEMAPARYVDEGLSAPFDRALTMATRILTSRGRVALHSARPDAKPRISHTYLATEDDRATMIASVRLAMDLFAQPNLSTVRRAPFSVPVPEAERDIAAFNPATGLPCDSPDKQTSFRAYLTANLSSTGMTTTVNGVPASSLTCGSGEPKALPPTIAFS
jgi:choline dehydrogenase-like flavoprotein